MSPAVKLFFKRVGTALLSAFIFLASAEICLRVYLKAPRGLFLFSCPGQNGMYLPNATFLSPFGAVPYTIKTNSIGLRCSNIPAEKTGLRIAMIGDSITDGLLVNNEDTYPSLLGETLRQRNHDVEVINGAKGAGSIDKEYAILREVVGPLDPDIIVLTFVTNDIREICGKTRDQMLSLTMKPSLSEKLLCLLYTKTAIGEVSLDVYLRDRFESYRAYDRQKGTSSEDYYNIAGGDRFEENARIFEKRWGTWDGIILKEPFSAQTNHCIDDYFFVQGKFFDYCAAHHEKAVVVYFPSYSQIYDPARTSMKMRDLLAQNCSRLKIPFLDLTSTFQDAGRNQVLHLAPLDFHLNPRGNKVMSSAVADFLQEQGLLQRQ